MTALAAADVTAPLDERRANIGIQPVSSNVTPNTICTVNLAIQAGALTVDSVDAQVFFDCAHLRVVDAGGNEVSSITAGQQFQMWGPTWLSF